MGYVHGPMFFSVLLSANLLLVQFCLRGPVPGWESVIGSEGIPGIGALTRSGRTVVFAENLPYALWVKRIFLQKSCREADSEPSELPKQIPSVPAPLRHIKKVEGYEKHREK